MNDYTKMSDEEVRRDFLIRGSSFFSWNSGKNTPNILLGLSNQISDLNQNLVKASESSSKLATALNRLTLAAVIIYGLTLLIAVVNLVLSFVL